jgi:folate-binding protein YgfZ
MKNFHAYEAALNDAVCFFQPEAGLLRLAGSDRIDFLQRQTTNDLRLLTSDRVVNTVLTSPTARILDVFCLLDKGEEIAVLTLPTRNGESEKFLRSRIFFSDNVSLADVSLEHSQIHLIGPKAGDVLQGFGIQPPETDRLLDVKLGDYSVSIIGRKQLLGIGYHLVVSRDNVAFVLAKFTENGILSLDSETYDILRVEAGQPGVVGELVADYTPLEVLLNEFISDSKGCYTGQEIIARQITYDKVNKNLVGIKLSNPVRVGATIGVDGKTVGTITSVAKSPRFGYIALGVIRRPYNQIGQSLSIVAEDISSLQAKVVDLPFQ